MNTVVKGLVNKWSSKLLLTTLLMLSFQFLMFFPTSHGQETYAKPVSITEVQRPIIGNYIEIEALVYLSNSYHLYDSSLEHRVDITINFTFATPPAQRYQITLQTLFSLSNVTVPSDTHLTYGFWGYPPIGTLTFDLPGNMSSGTILLQGQIAGNSILYRNTVDVPYLFNISSPIGYVSSFELGLMQPSSSDILKVYSATYQTDLRPEETEVKGHKFLIVSKTYPGIDFLVLYEHRLWTPIMVTLFVVAILILIAVPSLIVLLRRGKRLSKFELSFKRIQILFHKVFNSVGKIQKKLFRLEKTSLLAIYMTCALLILSLSVMVGPDPRLKVYILSSTDDATKNISNIVSEKLGGVAITVFDEMSEFPTLTNIGIFSAVIIADFYPPNQNVLRQYIYPGLDNLPRHYDSIIILKQYADKTFADEVQKRYPNVATIENLDSLGDSLSKIPKRGNLLGLKISSTFHLEVAAFLGALSFILVFFALAFLSFALIEAGKKPSTLGLFEAVTYSAFVFLFTEIVYIVSSVLLATPLGLHSAGGRITAVGLLGFGAGSRPRMLAGILGFLFGALISFREGVKISRIGAAAFLVILFFILVDPLTGGLVFYEFILLYSAGTYSFETAATTMYHFKDFLSSIGVALGGWTSPTLLISTGIVLFYMGAIPFFLFPRLQRSTATVMLFFCAFSAGSGIIRVANMRPWDAFMSLLPGIMAGFVAALVFYAISSAEQFIKNKLERGGLV